MGVEDRLVFQAGNTIEDGSKAALQFVNESTKATAIQAVNDMVAVGCANTFLNQGIKIPEHLSMAGFGNFGDVCLNASQACRVAHIAGRHIHHDQVLAPARVQ